MDVTNPEEIRSSDEAESPAEEESRLEILAFMLEDEEYGVNIMSIREIIRPIPITSVPRVPDYIMGIISLRGRILPVFDLRSRLKLSAAGRPKKPRYIVVTTKQGLVGLVADTVTGVLRVPESVVDPPPSIIVGEEGEFIRGVAKEGERLVILLDIERVFHMGTNGRREGKEKELQT